MMTLKSNQRGDCFALTTAFIETRCECTTDSLIIGCVLSGIKHIEANGLCVTLREGDIFYICKGAYIETNIPLGSYTYDDLCVMIYDHEIEQLQHAFSSSENRTSVVTTECIGRIGRIGNVRHNDLFAFFKEVERFDAFQLFRKGKEHYLFLHGTEDETALLADIRRFTHLYKLTLVEIPGAGHRFTEPGEMEKVVFEAVSYMR